MSVLLCATCYCSSFFFFNDTATTEIYTLSLHDALPIFTRMLANVEAVPDALTSIRATAISQQYGKAQLVICRHIFEHACKLNSFLAGLTGLVAPDGYLMLEVPDCTSSLERSDYTMLSEG